MEYLTLEKINDGALDKLMEEGYKSEYDNLEVIDMGEFETGEEFAKEHWNNYSSSSKGYDAYFYTKENDKDMFFLYKGKVKDKGLVFQFYSTNGLLN